MGLTATLLNKDNLRYLVDLRYADLSNQILLNRYYFEGGNVSSFDMIQTQAMRDILCYSEPSECDTCLIGSQLNKYKDCGVRI